MQKSKVGWGPSWVEELAWSKSPSLWMDILEVGKDCWRGVHLPFGSGETRSLGRRIFGMTEGGSHLLSREAIYMCLYGTVRSLLLWAVAFALVL
jgi:hypothetical protein